MAKTEPTPPPGTLWERFERALKYAEGRGYIDSERDIPRKVASVLGDGFMSPAYVATARQRLQQNPDANLHRRHAELFAWVCGVRREWLLHGEGDQLAPEAELTAQQKSLRDAVLTRKRRGRPPRGGGLGLKRGAKAAAGRRKSPVN